MRSQRRNRLSRRLPQIVRVGTHADRILRPCAEDRHLVAVAFDVARQLDLEVPEPGAAVALGHGVESVRSRVAENGGVAEQAAGERRHAPAASPPARRDACRPDRGRPAPARTTRRDSRRCRRVCADAHACSVSTSWIDFRSDVSCCDVNARAVASVSPVTYVLGHDSPLPTLPSAPTASIQTVSVSVRSADA